MAPMFVCVVEAAPEDGAAVVGTEVPEADSEEVAVTETDMETPDGRKPAATFGFDERKPAARSLVGHPVVVAQGSNLQQPRNGGVVPLHVYH